MRPAIIGLLLGLAGCGPDPRQIELNNERGLRAQAEEQKAQAEQRAAVNEKHRDAWQMAATVSIAGAVLLLVVGAGLGSMSKRDARRP